MNLDKLIELARKHIDGHPGNYISTPGETIIALAEVAKAANLYASSPEELEAALKRLEELP